jgi:hypothetical protein
MLDVPAELLRYLSRLLAAERRFRGTPARSRRLTCRDQAILSLRWFRDRTRIEQLGRDHGISRATAYRYVAEAVDVLSQQAPGLPGALERAMADGVPYVILDGKVFETDRCSEPATSVKGRQIDAWHSGKAHRHGGNVQAVMRPDGLPLWAGPAEPGSVHDITAARQHALPALYRAAALGMPTLADLGYEGAGIGILIPVKTRPETRNWTPGPVPGTHCSATSDAPENAGSPCSHSDGPSSSTSPPAPAESPNNPRRPRPHPIRAQIHHVKLSEITSVDNFGVPELVVAADHEIHADRAQCLAG